jgi:hypothetical protein
VGKPRGLQATSHLSAGLAGVIQILFWVQLVIAKDLRRPENVMLPTAT